MRTAVVTVFKGERPEYIREWVAFHLVVGFDLAFLLCNDEDPTVAFEAVRPFCERGEVYIESFADVKFLQTVAYAQAFDSLRDQFTWCAFIDSDEFVVPRPPFTSIKEVLSRLDHDQVGAVMLHWKVFSSSGYDVHPRDILQIEAYTSRLADTSIFNCTLKTILKCKAGVRPIGSHHWELVDGYFTVNSSGRLLPNLMHKSSPITYENAQLNHYVTRSRQDYAQKIERGWPSGGGSRKIPVENRWKIWNSYHESSVPDDETSRRFRAPVRGLLSAR